MKLSYYVFVAVCIGLGIIYFADISRLFAGDIEKKAVEDKKAELNNVKLALVEARAKVETTMKDLKSQRDALRQKIKDARQEFQSLRTTLNIATRKALSEYQQSLRALKASAKIEIDRQEADDIANKAIAVMAGVEQELTLLNAIEPVVAIE